MKKTSLLIAALAAAAALAPVTASAQRPRDFDDSWFWGVKAGVSTVSPTLGSTQSSATYGLDWMITRTRGGLYISGDESNVSAVSAVLDPSASAGFRAVDVHKLRRIGFAALAFPYTFGRFRPYAGVGLMVSVVGDATPVLGPTETTVDDQVLQRIDDRRSQANLLGMAGLQMQFHKLAVFGQASFSPSASDFLLNNSALGFYEAGVRYNFGTSREGLH